MSVLVSPDAIEVLPVWSLKAWAWVLRPGVGSHGISPFSFEWGKSNLVVCVVVLARNDLVIARSNGRPRQQARYDSDGEPHLGGKRRYDTAPMHVSKKA